jgi:transcriptional regulator with XRE-family HTH domain
MQLTKPEIIQILRKRAGLNQAQLGSRAFETTMDSGRTKIKNLELGIQRPTDDDLRRIAECLQEPFELFQHNSDSSENSSIKSRDGILISQKIVDMFPDLEDYLGMLDKAARMDDADLIDYLTKRIGRIMLQNPAASSLKISTV